MPANTLDGVFAGQRHERDVLWQLVLLIAVSGCAFPHGGLFISLWSNEI
jgi:hypothetical protein